MGGQTFHQALRGRGGGASQRLILSPLQNSAALRPELHEQASQSLAVGPRPDFLAGILLENFDNSLRSERLIMCVCGVVIVLTSEDRPWSAGHGNMSNAEELAPTNQAPRRQIIRSGGLVV